jgi:receptor expression-enhancing protein 1/2/3/4
MAGGRTKDLQAEEMTASGTLIPPNISSNADKMTYIAMQRERLRVLMSAFDKEANNLSKDADIATDVEKRMRDIDQVGRKQDDGLRKSKSELEFVPVEHEGTESDTQGKATGGGGSWMPWGWGANPGAGQTSRGADKGASSGVDVQH